MATLDKQSMSHEVDLSMYMEDIASENDLPLFEDAVKSAKNGALRAAYVMLWLACAESLKRRFKEAQERDNGAGRVVKKIEKREKLQHAVDKMLLDEARKYGFLSDTGHAYLLQVYDNRCIYAHPYEEAPSPEKVLDAAATVVDQVLSRPVKLRHGYVSQLLDHMLKTRTYLADQELAVAEFVKEHALPRIDEAIHRWLLDQYWEQLESISGDPAMTLFFHRGKWFTRAFVSEVGFEIFDDTEWHDRAVRFPRTMTVVCCTAGIFERVGALAQDTLVASIVGRSTTSASDLDRLMRLYDAGVLSDGQRCRFEQCVSGLPMSTLRSCNLNMKLYYKTLIQGFKSYHFATQNVAVGLLVSQGPEQANTLVDSEQVELGRNILQSAEGFARDAIHFLEGLSDPAMSWPLGIVRGIVLEVFANEQNRIRLKVRHIHHVLSALETLDKPRRDELLNNVVDSIDASDDSNPIRAEDLATAINALNACPWGQELAHRLEEKLQVDT